mgnify:FL=1
MSNKVYSRKKNLFQKKGFSSTKNHRALPGMPYATIFYIARTSLMSKKLRTVLTLFGVGIGVGAVYFLLAFGIWLRNLVTNEIVGN